MQRASLERSVSPAPDKPPSDGDFIDFVDAARTLWRRRRLVGGLTLASAVLTAAITLMIPNKYTAVTSVMPLDSSADRLSTAVSAFGALSGLSAQAGLNLKGSVADKFVAILHSRTILERVIKKQQLLPEMFPDRWDDERAAWKSDQWSRIRYFNKVAPSLFDGVRYLDKVLKISGDPKTGMITLGVEMEDATLSAAVANQFTAELDSFLQTNSLSIAGRNRDFLQKQVDSTVRELTELEDALKEFQEKHQLVSISAQTEASVRAYADLKAQLLAKEIELKMYADSLSAEDMQVIALKQQVEGLRAKITSIESGPSQGIISFKDAPTLGLQFARLKRDLMVKEKAFEVLTQQLELSKIEASKESLSFQLIDRAVPPDKKSSPKRSLIVLVVAFACFVFTSLGVLGAKALGAERM